MSTVTPPKLRSTRSDDELDALWLGIVTGELGLHDLNRESPALLGLWTHGYDTGSEALAAMVRQSQHDADRMYITAMTAQQGLQRSITDLTGRSPHALPTSSLTARPTSSGR